MALCQNRKLSLWKISINTKFDTCNIKFYICKNMTNLVIWNIKNKWIFDEIFWQNFKMYKIIMHVTRDEVNKVVLEIFFINIKMSLTMGCWKGLSLTKKLLLPPIWQLIICVIFMEVGQTKNFSASLHIL